MKHTKHLPRFLLLSLLCVPQLAAAQMSAGSQDAGSTFQRHLGFFFRPELGFGYMNASTSLGGVDFSVKGSGAALGLAFGGAVSEGFIVGAQVWDVVASSPTITMGSTTVSTNSSTSAGVVGYGVLLNWYMQPSNIYLAVTPSLTRLVMDDGTSSATTEWGFGLRGAVGKEWWVSDNWGVGVSGSLAFSSNKDSSASGAPTWSTVSFGIGVSATYN
jgi:hypothetical protein